MVRALTAILLLAGASACGGSGGETTTPTPVPTPSVATCSAAPVSGRPLLRAELVASSFERPLDLQTPGDRSRLFVVEQVGRIRILRGRTVVPTPFLDISDRVSLGIEKGLLGLAFHPRFGENGRFFVNYTDSGDTTHIVEFRAGAGADTVDPSTERPLLVLEQPFDGHKAGQLAFGSDGYLYISLGDGGAEGDPFGHSQNLRSLLGKILRVDVDRAQPYAVPADNPFVAHPDARAEIWAFGLRNPWRFAFDRVTGDLFIGDVGQDQFEEINLERAPRRGGQNYGWNLTEGSGCYRANRCPTEGITFPIIEYNHAEGCSVTGGVVYRGCRMPGHAGTYFYGDFCSGFVSSIRLDTGEQLDWTSELGPHPALTSFGVDADGEVYMLELTGNLYQIVPAS
jgi:glucose/arabinose dehydrogenase